MHYKANHTEKCLYTIFRQFMCGFLEEVYSENKNKNFANFSAAKFKFLYPCCVYQTDTKLATFSCNKLHVIKGMGSRNPLTSVLCKIQAGVGLSGGGGVKMCYPPPSTNL